MNADAVLGVSWVRVAFWNGLILCALLAVLFMTVEAHLRATSPFMRNVRPTEFVPGVGLRFVPRSKVQATNMLDFWTSSRANRLGFLDREPPTPERAAASCHVAVVGDSFVEAPEVPISDKMQVRLEEMAREQFPGWDVTTAAYGFSSLGQINQLPYWNEWISSRQPKLVVLVFVDNDFGDNRKDAKPLAHAKRDEDGTLRIVPPSPLHVHPSQTLWGRIQNATWVRLPPSLRPYTSYWLSRKLRGFLSFRRPPVLVFGDDDKTQIWPYTALALDQWRQRTQADGATLVVLATHTLTYSQYPDARDIRLLDRLEQIAAGLEIPVIDQADHILRQGGTANEAHFRYDRHWNRQGHQWAAEALLDWMAANPVVCER